MKLDIKRQTSNAIITQAPESYQVTRESLENFESSLIRIKQGEKRKRCHPKSDFPLFFTSDASLNQKTNEQTNHE